MTICKGDLIICFNQDDFVDRTSKGAYNFDVCRTLGAGVVTWTVEIDEVSTPSLSHSAFQLVAVEADGTPMWNAGVNSEIPGKFYKPYSGGWGSATSTLPDGMVITGDIGDRSFSIEVPCDLLGADPDFYWAMNVEADFAGTSGSSQYFFPGPWISWDKFNGYADACCEEIIPESEGWFLTSKGPYKHPSNPQWGVECNWIYLGILQPGETMYVIQSYHLDKDVDNWGQSDKVTFDIELMAQQIEGDPMPPPPGPVLLNHGRP